MAFQFPSLPPPLSDELIQRMLGNLARLVGPNSMWAFDPEKLPVYVGHVWGDGYRKRLAKEAPTEGEKDARWWPCVISSYDGYPYRLVLCDPLLEQGCLHPWPTHPHRLMFWPRLADQTPLPESTVTIESISSSEASPRSGDPRTAPTVSSTDKANEKTELPAAPSTAAPADEANKETELPFYGAILYKNLTIHTYGH